MSDAMKIEALQNEIIGLSTALEIVNRKVNWYRLRADALEKQNDELREQKLKNPHIMAGSNRVELHSVKGDQSFNSHISID